MLMEFSTVNFLCNLLPNQRLKNSVLVTTFQKFEIWGITTHSVNYTWHVSIMICTSLCTPQVFNTSMQYFASCLPYWFKYLQTVCYLNCTNTVARYISVEYKIAFSVPLRTKIQSRTPWSDCLCNLSLHVTKLTFKPHQACPIL